MLNNLSPNTVQPTKLNLVFAGTPEFAKTILAALLAEPKKSDFNVIAVYTQPDKPSGRGKVLTKSPVKLLAEAYNIPVLQPNTLKNNFDAIAQLQALKADLMIVAAYGLILSPAILAIPRLGCINVHASILPKWRGAAPIQQAILAGDKETGITIMQMDAGMDTGDILAIESLPILPDDTSASLHEKLAVLGANTLLNVLNKLNKQPLSRIKQDDTQATYAKKINKNDAQINFFTQALTIENSIRAFNPWPIAFTVLDNIIIRVLKAEILPHTSQALPGTIINNKEFIDVATSSNSLRLLVIQLPGGKKLTTKEILQGHSALFALNKQFASKTQQ